MSKINTIGAIPLLEQYYSRYGGFWEYPDMLDYCYLVNPYFNRSKIIDEMQDNFRMLVSEYPAGNEKLFVERKPIKETISKTI